MVNFDLPVERDQRTPQYETYLHRIGRSGRFGRKGVAFNLVSGFEVRVYDWECSHQLQPSATWKIRCVLYYTLYCSTSSSPSLRLMPPDCREDKTNFHLGELISVMTKVLCVSEQSTGHHVDDPMPPLSSILISDHLHLWLMQQINEVAAHCTLSAG